jgi:hypothetical protein
LFGLGIGNATTLPPLIAQTEFSKTQAIRVVALIVAISQALYAFAPAACSILLAPVSDLAKSTQPTTYFFSGIATLQILALCAVLAGRRKSF